MTKAKRDRQDESAPWARADRKKVKAVQRGNGWTDKIPLAQRFGLATPKAAEEREEMDEQESDSSGEATDDGQPATIGQITALMKQQVRPVTKGVHQALGYY